MQHLAYQQLLHDSSWKHTLCFNTTQRERRYGKADFAAEPQAETKKATAFHGGQWIGVSQFSSCHCDSGF